MCSEFHFKRNWSNGNGRVDSKFHLGLSVAAVGRDCRSFENSVWTSDHEDDIKRDAFVKRMLNLQHCDNVSMFLKKF